MSITLDVNNFLQNEVSTTAATTTTPMAASVSDDTVANCGTAPQNAAHKMEALLHKELQHIAAELPTEDSANIFDEIENFLKLNKYVDSSNNALHQQSELIRVEATPASAALSSPLPPARICSPSLEFSDLTSALCMPTKQLLMTPMLPAVQQQQKEQQSLEPPTTTTTITATTKIKQFYSVHNDQMLPITTSVQVETGIFRKINTAEGATAADERSSSAPTPIQAARPNVFISGNGEPGSVLSVSRFHELYMCADANGELPPELVPPMMLLQEFEQQTDATGTPALGLNCGIRVTKQWDALSKLAYDILKLSNKDHIVIDRKRNEIVRTNNATKQRIIYRFLTPENFGLTSPSQKSLAEPGSALAAASAPSPPIRPPTKYGRPPKRKVDAAIAANDNALAPNDKERTQKKRRQQEQSNKNAAAAAAALAKAAETAGKPAVRTRFGRIVRTRLDLQSTTPAEAEPTDNSLHFMQNYLADLKDGDFRYSKCNATTTAAAKTEALVAADTTGISNSTTSSPPSIAANADKRKMPPPEAVCPTCGKIFWGRRMLRHYIQHPDHRPAAAAAATTTTNASSMCKLTNGITTAPARVINNNDMTLFRFFITKLQRTELSEDQRAELFLNEINDFVEQLQLRSSRLIHNTTGLHHVTSRCSRVLGIPEGHYALDMTAIESEEELPQPPSTSTAHIDHLDSGAPRMLLHFEHLSSSALPAPRALDYSTLSMSLDDTLTDEAAQKLNLSAGGKLLPPSEESLLRTVGDLVHDGLQQLQQQTAAAAAAAAATAAASTGMPFNVPATVAAASVSKVSAPCINYDHASDNAVEAVSMKETIAVRQQQQQQQASPLLGLPVDFFQFSSQK